MKMKRLISIIFSVALLVALLCSPAHAATPRASTDRFRTPAMTAGVEWSGYAAGKIYNMLCESKNSLNGDDIEIDFYQTGVGLSPRFVRDSTRHGVITVKEDDAGSNQNEVLFTKTGTFSYSLSIYCMRNYGTRSNINYGEIEDNNKVELYILVEIETKSGDTDTYIAPELIEYSFRTTY